MTAARTTKKTPAKKAAANKAPASSFTAEEKAAMKARAAEFKAEQKNADAEAEMLAAIDKMSASDKALAKKIAALVKKHAPELTARTWYGMPAWSKDGSVLVFFQNSGKFKVRYSTLGFNDNANLDDGSMWPSAYALTKLTKADEKRIGELLEQAVS